MPLANYYQINYHLTIMMESLRKHMHKVLWFITILFVGGIFFWFGTGSPDEGTVARVGKTRIDIREYQRSLNQHLNRIRDEYGGDLEQEQLSQIRREVLSSLINQELRYQEAKRIGVIVSEHEIIQTIRNLPQFQEHNMFNFNLYQQALRFSLNISPDAFEDLIRRDIAIRKMERMILSAIRVTQEELQLYYLSEYGDFENFNNNKQDYEVQILQRKRSDTYTHWIRNLHENYDVSVNHRAAGLTG